VKAVAIVVVASCHAGDPAPAPRATAIRDAAISPVIERIAGSREVLVTFVAHQPVAIKSQLCDSGDCADPTTHLDGTNVWYRTYRLRGDLRIAYNFKLAGVEMADPLNPRTIDQGGPFGRSILELPDAPPQPWNARRPNVREGRVSDLNVAGRSASVYTPADYDSTREYPLLVCFDGPVYLSADDVPGPAILDNLIAAHAIAPMIAVFVGQGAQRNVELSNNPSFLAYVADELLPAVRASWHATADPARTIVCGSSAGGLASAFAAHRRPDVFGNVLSQSGAFWPGETRDNPAHEWLTREYDAAPKRDIRFVLQVGILERGATPGGGPSILDTNRRLRDVLVRKGYDVHYTEVAGGHEPLSWRGGLADGLRVLAPRPP
jgi:enterochelin esterase-like enzyme